MLAAGSGLLAYPLSYTLAWQGQGVVLWRPVPPPGYVALGCVAMPAGPHAMAAAAADAGLPLYGSTSSSVGGPSVSELLEPDTTLMGCVAEHVSIHAARVYLVCILKKEGLRINAHLG